MVERGAGRGALVDRDQQVAGAVGGMVGATVAPGGYDRIQHAGLQVGQRGRMPGPVDHHLLPIEGGELVRHDAHRPTRPVPCAGAAPVGR